MQSEQIEVEAMATSVHVEMARLVDASSLLQALRVRGLTAELVSVEGRWEIEVVSRTDEPDQVMTAVSGALDTWLLERNLPFIPMRIGARAFTIRPPSD